MTFKEYLRHNRKSILFSLQLTGVIFTTLILIFVVPSTVLNDLPFRLLILFVISVLSGNVLSFIVCCLKLNSTFQQTKRNYKLFDTFSSHIVDEYLLQIKPKTDISKNNFLEIHIVGKIEETPIVIEVSDQKEIWITIINKLDNIPNFPKRRLQIEKKYRSQNITLTGWGFRNSINQKAWNKLTTLDIEKEIRRLFEISDNENIRY